jgi:hypothetical protein
MLEVLRSAPDRANAILYADVPALRTLTSGSMLHADLPESLGEIRIASNLNIHVIEPSWEIGCVTVANLSSAESIANSVGGYVDSVEGMNVVWSPKRLYLVPMPDNVLGLVRPSDRKLVGRWLRKEGRESTASYLQEQANQGTTYLSMLLAVDLKDSLSRIAIRERIESFDSLKGKDLDAMADILSQVNGIRVIVGRKSLAECIIGLDFASSPSALLPIAKDLFAEILSRNDASISEVTSWVPKLEGNSLSFRGTINADTIDDLLGIFTLHRQASATASSAPEMQVTNSESEIRETSDIIKRVRDYTARGTGERAHWNGQMARRLDELPTLKVDPELVDYAAKVSQGLRGNMLAIQRTNISSSASSTVNSGSYGYYYDGNEPYKYSAVARAKGNTNYRETIAKIDQMEADMRRKMTQKYQVQF